MNSNIDIIKRNVISTLVSNWCIEKAKENLIYFNNSFISSYYKFRFTTPIIDKVLPPINGKKGYWNNGLFILYEIENNNGNISVSLYLSTKDLKDKSRLSSFLKSNMIEDNNDLIMVKSWNIFTSNNLLDNLAKALDYFYYNDLKKYEEDVLKWLNDPEYLIYDISYELVEGAIKNISTNKYERNKEARQKCLDYHGYKCKICGFDFGGFYGEQFSKKIEVHHIKPLNEIGQEYVVDPINDLIPVCPNCHMVLHSKEEGVFTPEEVINLIKHNQISHKKI